MPTVGKDEKEALCQVQVGVAPRVRADVTLSEHKPFRDGGVFLSANNDANIWVGLGGS